MAPDNQDDAAEHGDGGPGSPPAEGSRTDDHGRTRTHALFDACRAVGVAYADPLVDVAALAAIAAVVWADPDGAIAQVAVGAISSVAVGKRYLSRPKR